jgi:hypothetical protein
MRAIILVVAALCCIAATKKSIGTEVLRVEERNHFGVRFTTVSKKNGLWICKTEKVPYFETTVAPFDANLINKLTADIHSGCRNTVTIRFRGKIVNGCAEDSEFQSVSRRLAKGCGRVY